MSVFSRTTMAAMMALAALGTAASAQLPPKPGAKPATPAAPPPVSIPGVSAAGNAALNKLANSPDPAAKDAFVKLQALAPQISATVNAQPLNVDKFAAIMRQVDQLQSVIKARTTERLIASVRALPPADRAPFLKAISQRPPAQGAR